MVERASINQQVQAGVESTHGTAVAANKLFTNKNFQFGIEADDKSYRGTGRKYASVHVLNKEWTSGTMDGPLDFNDLIYPLSGALGTVSPAAHGSSATAMDWAFVAGLSGNANPKSFTFEQGDSVRAHKLAYGLFTSFNYKISRDEATCNSDLVGQLLSDGITMTSSPTAIALSPIAANLFTIYLDATSGGIGGTALTRLKSFEFNMGSIYNPAWFVNRSQTSWATHVDTAPAATGKLMLEADSVGMGLLTNFRASDTRYIRVEGIGAQIASDGPGAVNATFKHDMAVKLSKPDKWEDSDGIFAIGWEFEVVEDSAWGSGTSHTLTLTNLLTAL